MSFSSLRKFQQFCALCARNGTKTKYIFFVLNHDIKPPYPPVAGAWFRFETLRRPLLFTAHSSPCPLPAPRHGLRGPAERRAAAPRHPASGPDPEPQEQVDQGAPRPHGPLPLFTPIPAPGAPFLSAPAWPDFTYLEKQLKSYFPGDACSASHRHVPTHPRVRFGCRPHCRTLVDVLVCLPQGPLTELITKH